MECAWNAGAIILAKLPDARNHIFQIFARNFHLRQKSFGVAETCLGQSAQIHDNFDQFVAAGVVVNRAANVRRQRVQQKVNVTRNDLLYHKSVSILPHLGCVAE